MQVVPAHLARFLVQIEAACGKYPLPCPLLCGCGRLSGQGVGQRHETCALFQIAFVLLFATKQVPGQIVCNKVGQHGVAILAAFAAANGDHATSKVHVFHP